MGPRYLSARGQGAAHQAAQWAALLACALWLAPLRGLAQQAPEQPARDAGQLFATTCGWCHSKGGREAGKGPRLMGTVLSDQEIVQRIRAGKPGFMPGYEGTFSEAELQGLVAYIRALRPQ